MTARADLLALTADDLADITSRGAVKRALRELDAGEPVLTVRCADDGTVVVDAADATTVTLPPGVAVQDAPCTCDAVGCCRHVARAVLAYARDAATAQDAGAGAPPATAAPWDPGAFSDDDLAAGLRPAVLRRGRRLAAAGVTATLVRSAKPVALLHDAGVAVRFVVPGELAYARCDCVDPPPCEHVVAAVEAFRALASELDAGIVVLAPGDGAAGATAEPPPAAGLRALEAALALLAEAGVATGREAPRDALRHAETRCRTAGLPWVADTCAELADLCDRHARGDGTFDPERVAQLAGEALLRGDALAAPSRAVPRLFAGGPRSAAETAVAGGRLVGIGTRVRAAGPRVDVDALVYDTSAHRLLARGRTFDDPPDSPPRPFAELAATSLQRGIAIAGAGAGQLVATGGARSAAGRLRLGRRPAALSAQRFEWDAVLRAPVLAEGAAEARALASAALPAPLGLRTAGAGIVVLALASIAEAGFHVASGSVVALARDALGAEVLIVHPYSGRAAGGSERLLARLAAVRDGTAAARFVAGEARMRGARLEIRPTGLVVEDAGGHRELCQPWVDRGDAAAAAAIVPADAQAPAGEPAVDELLGDLQEELGALLVTGVARADRSVREQWALLGERMARAGSVTLARAVDRVAAALAARAHDPRWEAGPAVAALLELAPAVELARALR